MTKKEMFSLIATVNADNAEIVEFCNHEIDLLDKRGSSKSPTKNQKANEAVMDAIALALEAVGSSTVTDLIANSEALNGLTCQKVSALLRKMVLDGRVVKEMDGKKAYFSVAEGV